MLKKKQSKAKPKQEDEPSECKYAGDYSISWE